MAVVIHPATGVPQRYYTAFATWLAQSHRAMVLIYDYRDMGLSASRPLPESTVRMSDWGVEDQSAALDWLCSAADGLPIWVIGHSLGGMFVSWHAQARRVERVIAVASGPAHVSRHPVGFLPKVWWFWFVGGPVLTRLFGYLPGKWVGLGADLPARVYWQWRRWCLNREFHRPEWGREMPEPDLTAVTGEVSLVAIGDDPMIPPKSVRLLSAFYPSAAVTFRTIAPTEAGVGSIGHLAIFSKQCKAAWPLLVARPA